MVELTEGELTNFWYVTDRVGSAKRSSTHGFRMPPLKGERLQAGIVRLDAWSKFLKKHLEKTRPDFVGIEDYSLDSAHGAHYKGELGGDARLLVYRAGVRLRLHDPSSMKMFVAHHGGADKTWIKSAVYSRWGQDFSRYDGPPPKKKKKKKANRAPVKVNRQTSEDLADAFGMAMLIWTEVLLRSGELLLSTLHEKEVQVFNRVTKTYPVNILGREWIWRENAA
jgi:hypothetical protein